MEPMALPGLERLMEVCQRLNLGLETSLPAREPLKAGSLLEGVPFDPILAGVYARMGHAAFATKVMRWVLARSDEQVHWLEEDNKRWREKWWKELADAWGRQPVVMVDTYEYEPKVMPVASDVDRFFNTCAHYLEAKISSPCYQGSSQLGLSFPWDATEILARDERLVELMRAGRFDSLMKNVDDETRRWAAKVMGTQV